MASTSKATSSVGAAGALASAAGCSARAAGASFLSNFAVVAGFALWSNRRCDLGLRAFRYDFSFRSQFNRNLGNFRCRRFFHRALSSLDDAHASLYGGLFLGEVLVANLLRQLFRNGVGRDADVYTFASHLFDEPLGVKL